MAQINVSIVIQAKNPAWTSAQLVTVFNFLAGIQTAANKVTNTTCQVSCTWDADNNLSATILISVTNTAGFASTDLDNIASFIKTNVTSVLPSYCNMTQSNYWAS